MYLIYEVFYIIAFLLYVLSQYAKKRYHSGILLRLRGIKKTTIENLKNKDVIWIHAVSVGEVLAARELIKKIHKNFPTHKILLTTITKTGFERALSIKDVPLVVDFMPADLSLILRKSIKEVNPNIFIALETEIWPNLVSEMQKAKVPFCVVNGRLSPQSMLRYEQFDFFFKDIFRAIDCFCVQDEESRRRFLKVGARKERVFVTGNLKFDTANQLRMIPSKKRQSIRNSYRELLGISHGELVIVGGSTHHNEEEMLIDLHKKILKKHPKVKLILVPRHMRREEEIKERLQKRSLKATILRENNLVENPYRDASIILVLAMGILTEIYMAGDIIVIGGSFVKKGGQNPLEAAALAKPTFFGHQMFNFPVISKMLVDAKASEQVSDLKSLEKILIKFITDQDLRDTYGANGEKFVEDQKDVSETIIEKINSYIKK